MTDPSAPDTSGKGVQHAPSETALATASMRAMAAHDPREEVRGGDTLAELFLTEEQKGPLQDARMREWVMKNKITPGAYEFMIARTAFFDGAFQSALAGKVPQIVLLGAGYDTRPYRFSHLLGAAAVFEIDAQPTQLHKKRTLEQSVVPIPPNVRFVPIDFAADDLEQVLLSAGYARDRAALFLWEGVTYYLSRETVDRTLGAVRRLSIPGSAICFDFASLSPEALSEGAAKKLRQQMDSNHAAEPTRFGIPQGKCEAFLSRHGFAVDELVTPTEMEARYLTLSDGSTIGRVPALFNLVLARAV
jgi:methyltransferase (TIGR00027 family)